MTTTTLTPRQTWLLGIVREQGGRWSTGRAEKLYRSSRVGARRRGTPRRDLKILARHGLLRECGPQDGRYFVEAPKPEGEPPFFVYRAAYDGIPMGLYTTAAAARAHCEDTCRDDLGRDRDLTFDWLADESEPLDPTELVVTVGPVETTTHYTVTAVEVAAEYDPEAEG
ncbi:hypothetical protein J3A78_003828 [Streptomyces sp. PvR006]|uniref:hypothetical protein n=1 Tax=Streptomyces sp. PvR006 TaxID=2817860 RepID=UPI001AE8169F|nr:hypothetical protein [Streptomyces sp. PvR006]MBP2583350.1 hypothetical protein [Streptomyces sp. PvR006]